jgi:hypothetical protein
MMSDVLIPVMSVIQLFLEILHIQIRKKQFLVMNHLFFGTSKALVLNPNLLLRILMRYQLSQLAVKGLKSLLLAPGSVRL